MNKLLLNLTVPSEYPVASNFMSNSISISVDNDFVNIISAAVVEAVVVVLAAAAIAVRVTVIYHIYNFIYKKTNKKLRLFVPCTHTHYFLFFCFVRASRRVFFCDCDFCLFRISHDIFISIFFCNCVCIAIPCAFTVLFYFLLFFFAFQFVCLN